MGVLEKRCFILHNLDEKDVVLGSVLPHWPRKMSFLVYPLLTQLLLGLYQPQA